MYNVWWSILSILIIQTDVNLCPLNMIVSDIYDTSPLEIWLTLQYCPWHGWDTTSGLILVAIRFHRVPSSLIPRQTCQSVTLWFIRDIDRPCLYSCTFHLLHTPCLFLVTIRYWVGGGVILYFPYLDVHPHTKIHLYILPEWAMLFVKDSWIQDIYIYKIMYWLYSARVGYDICLRTAGPRIYIYI